MLYSELKYITTSYKQQLPRILTDTYDIRFKKMKLAMQLLWYSVPQKILSENIMLAIGANRTFQKDVYQI